MDKKTSNAKSSEATLVEASAEKLLSLQDTDAGNAEAFELLHGNRFRFDHDKGKWLVWNGRYWNEDRDGEAKRAALASARARLSAAMMVKDHDEKVRRINWALSSESSWRLTAMLESARNIRSLATRTEQYDRDPFLLTVANGTLDLRSGKLRPSRPEDLITRATEVSCNPKATPSRWLQFLNEVFVGDQDLSGYIQRAVGYSLTGDTKEQCFFILFGGGANGKSTFVETLCKLLGTHAETAEFSTFLVRKNHGAPRNDVARLHAARFVKAAEGQQKISLDEALIKELTGEDTIAARFLFREHFSFKPRFKIWLVTNHKPDIRGTDRAIWRRVRLIPFKQQFDGKRRDPELRMKLEAELPGILAWAVEGCMAWQELGLGEAPRITQATLEYRRESDQMGRFLKDRCVLGSSGGTTPARELYEAYVEWCSEQREKAEGNNVFAKGLRDRAITGTRTRKGVVYKGLRLAPKPPSPITDASIKGGA